MLWRLAGVGAGVAWLATALIDLVLTLEGDPPLPTCAHAFLLTSTLALLMLALHGRTLEHSRHGSTEAELDAAYRRGLERSRDPSDRKSTRLNSSHR